MRTCFLLIAGPLVERFHAPTLLTLRSIPMEKHALSATTNASMAAKKKSERGRTSQGTTSDNENDVTKIY